MTDTHLNQPLMSVSGDPFHAFQEPLNKELDEISVRVEEWRNQLKTTNTYENHEFKALHEDLKGELKDIEEDISLFQEALARVESNRSNFPHIDDREIARRKNACDNIRSRWKAFQDELTSKATQGKINRDKKAILNRSPTSPTAEREHAYTRANERFVDVQMQEAKTHMADQDEALSSVAEHLDVVHERANMIGDELDYQGRELDHMETDMDEAQGKFDTVMRGIQKLLKTKSRCQICTIFILILILLGLSIAVLS